MPADRPAPAVDDAGIARTAECAEAVGAARLGTRLLRRRRPVRRGAAGRMVLTDIGELPPRGRVLPLGAPARIRLMRHRERHFFEEACARYRRRAIGSLCRMTKNANPVGHSLAPATVRWSTQLRTACRSHPSIGRNIRPS